MSFAQNLAKGWSIPAEALGDVRIVICGRSSVSIENHRGVLEFGIARIRIAVDRGCAVIYGSDLEICALNRGRIMVCGKIDKVELE